METYRRFRRNHPRTSSHPPRLQAMTVVTIHTPRSGNASKPGFPLTNSPPPVPRARNLSIGQAVDTTIGYLTLSKPARKVGNWVQGECESGPRHLAGSAINACATVVDGIAKASVGAVVGAVTVAGKTVYLAGDAVARVAAASALGVAAAGARVSPLNDGSPAGAEALALGAAKDLLRGAALNRQSQKEPSAEVAGEAVPLATLAMGPRPEGFRAAPKNFIPKDALSGVDAAGRRFRLQYHNGRLWGDSSNALDIRVSTEGIGGTIYLAFMGTEASRERMGTFVTDASQAVFGREGAAMGAAVAVVTAFAAQHGAGKVKLVGHSLGGALAQWAAAWNDGVHATCFNAGGLHAALRARIGGRRVDAVHFNSSNDALSQFFEAPHSPISASEQIGTRYRVPVRDGSRMPRPSDHLMGPLRADLRVHAGLPEVEPAQQP